MRLMAMAAALAMFAQEKSEAEELFKRMEAALLGAKSLTIRARGSSKIKVHNEPDTTTHSDYTVYVLDANRIRIETASTLLVSNGIQLKEMFKPPARFKPEAQDAPASMGADWRRCFALNGLADGFKRLRDNPPTLKDVRPPKGFQLKENERIGDRDARCITYQTEGLLGWKVWIDPKTHLPLQRRGFGGPTPEEDQYMESYAEILIDGLVDPGRFTVPDDQADLVAEGLYRTMGDTLLLSKNLRFSHRSILQPDKVELRGEVLLGEGGRARIEAAGKGDALSKGSRLITDGRQVHHSTGGDKVNGPREASALLAPNLRISLVRAGVLGTLAPPLPPAGAEIDPLAGPTASDFRLAGKEKAKGGDVQIIEFKVRRMGDPDKVAKVWIDPVTCHPVKYVLSWGAASVTEYYSDFKTGEAFDPSLFEMPKEAK